MPLQTPVRRLFRVALITGMGLAVAGCASLTTTPPPNYDLSGVWQLNAALSDSPSLASLSRNPKEGRRSSGRGQGDRSGPPQGGRGGGGGGRSRGEQNGQGGASGSRSQRPAKGGRQRISSLEAVKIEIEQNSESMGMEFDGTNYRDVSWGKRKRGDLTIESGWKEGDLIIKSTGGRMPVVERYVLSENGERVTVYIELDGGRNDLTFKRVFEKAPAR